jgi:Deltamethrin resistance
MSFQNGVVYLFLAVLRAQSSYAPAHHRTEVEIAKEQHSALNDIPVPSGSWQEHYDRRNSRWNVLLGVVSVIFLGSSVLVSDVYRFTVING